MKKTYVNPNCEMLEFDNVTMLGTSAEMTSASGSSVTFGQGNYDGELFQ